MPDFSEHRLLHFAGGPEAAPQPEGVETQDAAPEKKELHTLDEAQAEGDELIQQAENDEQQDEQRDTQVKSEKELTPEQQTDVMNSPEYKKLQEDLQKLDQLQAGVRQKVDGEPAVANALKEMGAYSILTRTHHIDPQRLQQGELPATYYENAGIDEMMQDTGNHSAYEHGTEMTSINGKEYANTIYVDDSAYGGSRTIDLHISDDGSTSYRSYRYVWDLEDVIRSVERATDKVDPVALQREDESNGYEEKFDNEHELSTQETSLDESTLETGRSNNYQKKLDRVLKKLPEGLQGRAYQQLMEGMKFREDKQGNFLICFRKENSAVFRHYWKTVFRQEKPNDTLKGSTEKYNDGSYSIRVRPDDVLSDLEYHIATLER